MALHIDLGRESDGRWLAQIAELPGVASYADSPKAAIAKVKALALQVIADKVKNGEPVSSEAKELFEALKSPV